jgi:hypothetical protein
MFHDVWRMMMFGLLMLVVAGAVFAALYYFLTHNTRLPSSSISDRSSQRSVLSRFQWPALQALFEIPVGESKQGEESSTPQHVVIIKSTEYVYIFIFLTSNINDIIKKKKTTP